MAKIGGGNVVMIMMLLLVSIIICYYMNTFITLHQCTFNLLFAFFLPCVSKNIPDVFSYNLRKHCRIFIIFGRHITEKLCNQRWYIFPPHLINASALPCETENTEIYLFHVNVLC